MKKILAVLVALAFAGSTIADTTWTSVTTDSTGVALPGYVVAVKGTFTATNGTDPSLATTTNSSLGINLRSLSGLTAVAQRVKALSAVTAW